MTVPVTGMHPNLTDDGPGLRFRPIKLSALRKPIFVIDDESVGLFIDLRSVCEALGMSWRRWDLTFKASRRQWQTESCVDRTGRETELIAVDRFLRWLDMAKPMIHQHSFAALERAKALRANWRSEWPELAPDVFPDRVPQPKVPAAKKAATRKRKITAAVVRGLYRLRSEGRSFREAAAALKISMSAAKSLASNTYPNLPEDARLAWEETFGSDFGR